MSERKKRVTKKVIKETSVKIRLTFVKRQEIRDFCEEHNVTISRLIEFALNRVMYETDGAKGLNKTTTESEVNN